MWNNKCTEGSDGLRQSWNHWGNCVSAYYSKKLPKCMFIFTPTATAK